MERSREAHLVQTFVELADTLVGDFDVVDFLHLLATRCVELLDAAEAGLLLVDLEGNLNVMTSSSERTRLLELFQLQNEEGPCLDCYHSGAPVVSKDLDADQARWPIFAPEARATGFASVHAFPLRLRHEVVGALNLFRALTGDLSEADAAVAQALADVATIGILQERAVREGHVTVEQLQTALNSRIVIEQAKGMLAEKAGIDMAEAFTRLRRYARDHSQRLGEVAQALIDGSLEADRLSARERESGGH
jgi:transcriptional regulator with GAF, ATPase, and Fis domain